MLIRLRPTRNELIEMCVLAILAAGIWLGLRSGTLTSRHLPFVAGGYAAYIAWALLREWRGWSNGRRASP